jgi:hypothetical protein
VYVPVCVPVHVDLVPGIVKLARRTELDMAIARGRISILFNSSKRQTGAVTNSARTATKATWECSSGPCREITWAAEQQHDSRHGPLRFITVARVAGHRGGYASRAVWSLNVPVPRDQQRRSL